MANYLGNLDSSSNRSTLHYAVADGVTVTEGDFVSISAGRVSPTAAGAVILGLADGGGTGDAAGTVTVPVIVHPDAKYQVQQDNVGATFDGATDVGQFFDIVGATGAQLADTSSESASSGQLFVVDYDATQGTDKCVVVIAERQGRL